MILWSGWKSQGHIHGVLATLTDPQQLPRYRPHPRLTLQIIVLLGDRIEFGGGVLLASLDEGELGFLFGDFVGDLHDLLVETVDLLELALLGNLDVNWRRHS